MEPIKDAFLRLLRFGRAAKARALTGWQSATVRFALLWRWLRLRRGVVCWVVGISIAAALLIGFVLGGGPSWYGKHHAALAPLLTLAAGVSVAAVALIRHFAQTDADRQRRITESFSKAVEQLGSDKLEVRLGGIYSLERISKESPDDYWTVMENLTAFVRERSRRNEAERTSQDLEQRVSRRAYFLWQEAGWPDGRAEDFWAQAVEQEELGELATDVAAVLTVIKRRSEQSRKREGANNWRLDLSGAVLRHANLSGAHLDRANFSDAYLERTNLGGAHLEGATLWDAHLEEAHLTGVHLKDAQLRRAHLEGARLGGAHLEEAHLFAAHLEGAYLGDAHLEGAHLSSAHLEGADLSLAHLEKVALVGTRLEGACLRGAHFEGATLWDTHFEGADLRDAPITNLEISADGAYEAIDLWSTTGLSETELLNAHGDAATKLPEGVARPAHWPEAAPESAH
jgi:uncharacterized protein YjbI with pentapeptide repeats